MCHSGTPEDHYDYRYDDNHHYDHYDNDNNDDNSSNSSFAAFQMIVKPHTTRIRRLHMHVYGNHAYDFYALLAQHNQALALHALEHFLILMSEYGFRDDSRNGVLPPQSFFALSRPLTQLTFHACLPLKTHLLPSICSRASQPRRTWSTSHCSTRSCTTGPTPQA
jgi:hypothetical protein